MSWEKLAPGSSLNWIGWDFFHCHVAFYKAGEAVGAAQGFSDAWVGGGPQAG